MNANHVVRLYVAVAATVLFFLLWAVIAAHPWVETSRAAPDPRLNALAAREKRLQRRADEVKRIIDHRWRLYETALGRRQREIAVANQHHLEKLTAAYRSAVAAAAAANAQAAEARAYAARVTAWAQAQDGVATPVAATVGPGASARPRPRPASRSSTPTTTAATPGSGSESTSSPAPAPAPVPAPAPAPAPAPPPVQVAPPETPPVTSTQPSGN